MTKTTNSSRNEVIQAIADSMRNQMVNGWSKREVKSYAAKINKATGVDIDVEGTYQAVKLGWM